MKTRLFFGIMCIALILAAPGAQAATIVYDSGAPNYIGGYNLDKWIEAMDFKLTSPLTTFDHVRFTGQDSNPSTYAGSITWQIYADNADSAGSPGALLASNTVTPVKTFLQDGTDQALEYKFYLFDFAISPQTLSADTTYWLALYNGPIPTSLPVTETDFYWAFTSNATGIGNYWSDVNSPGWAPDGDVYLSFQLYQGNPVPLPGAVWLLGSGLLGLIGLRKKLRS